MRTNVRYFGNVQGVGFRATVRGIARTLPVTGWVRNEADGSVTLEVQGDNDSISTLLDRVRKAMGPMIQSEQIAGTTDVDRETGFVIAR